jgi:hypothetical protein
MQIYTTRVFKYLCVCVCVILVPTGGGALQPCIIMRVSHDINYNITLVHLIAKHTL